MASILKTLGDDGAVLYVQRYGIVGDMLYLVKFTDIESDAIVLPDYLAILVATYYARSKNWISSLERVVTATDEDAATPFIGKPVADAEMAKVSTSIAVITRGGSGGESGD